MGGEWPGVGRSVLVPSLTLCCSISAGPSNNALQKVTRLSGIESPPVPSPRLRTTGPSGRNLSAQLGSRLDVTATGNKPMSASDRPSRRVSARSTGQRSTGNQVPGTNSVSNGEARPPPAEDRTAVCLAGDRPARRHRRRSPLQAARPEVPASVRVHRSGTARSAVYELYPSCRSSRDKRCAGEALAG